MNASTSRRKATLPDSNTTQLVAARWRRRRPQRTKMPDCQDRSPAHRGFWLDAAQAFEHAIVQTITHVRNVHVPLGPSAAVIERPYAPSDGLRTRRWSIFQLVRHERVTLNDLIVVVNGLRFAVRVGCPTLSESISQLDRLMQATLD